MARQASKMGDYPKIRISGDFSQNQRARFRLVVLAAVVRAGLGSRMTHFFLCLCRGLLMRQLRNQHRKCWNNYVLFHGCECQKFLLVSHNSVPLLSLLFFAGIRLPFHHTRARFPAHPHRSLFLRLPSPNESNTHTDCVCRSFQPTDSLLYLRKRNDSKEVC
jgi:hypothetical protein